MPAYTFVVTKDEGKIWEGYYVDESTGKKIEIKGSVKQRVLAEKIQAYPKITIKHAKPKAQKPATTKPKTKTQITLIPGGTKTPTKTPGKKKTTKKPKPSTMEIPQSETKPKTKKKKIPKHLVVKPDINAQALRIIQQIAKRLYVETKYEHSFDKLPAFVVGNEIISLVPSAGGARGSEIIWQLYNSGNPITSGLMIGTMRKILVDYITKRKAAQEPKPSTTLIEEEEHAAAEGKTIDLSPASFISPVEFKETGFSEFEYKDNVVAPEVPFTIWNPNQSKKHKPVPKKRK